MTLRRALQTGLVLGALWGFVEVVFTYLTGFAPASDALEILLAPMAILVLYEVTMLAAFKIRPHGAFEFLRTASILIPPVQLFLRGRGQRAPLHLLAGLLPVALGLALVFLETRKRSERGWLRPARIAALLFVYFSAALAFAVRSDRVDAMTFLIVATAALWCASTAAVAAMAATAPVPKRTGTAALMSVLFAGSFAIAWQRGSNPPSYKAEVARPRLNPSAPQPPNVLLIVLDTVRADRLDLYGHSRPTFSRTGAYLRDGLVFDRASSSGTFSLTSHASLFTGLLPSAHGAHPVLGGDTSYGRLWPDLETLATFLRSRGYRTVGVSANDIFLAEWTGLQTGFDTFSASARRAMRFLPLPAVIRRSMMQARGQRRESSNNWSAAQVTEAAIDIAALPEPFFLFLNYFDAHGPHEPLGSPPWFDPAAAQPIDIYDTEIAALDVEVARLLGSLEERGLLKQTLVIITADHGEYFNERQLRGHPAAVYQTSTHIPLALRLPGVVPALRSERRTGLHEVFRMVRDVLEGKSLEWLTAPDLTPRILTEAWARRDYGKNRPADARPSTTVVFAGNLKLIHRLSGRLDLYDLEADPAEEKNLIDSTEPRIMALKEKMLREVDLRVVRPPGPAQALTEDAKERLRALGYLK